MKDCIPQICNYEYCRQRSVDDKLFKEAVKALEYWSYISFGRSKKHHIVVSNKLNEGMRNTRLWVNVQRMWGQSWQSTNCSSCFLPQSFIFQPCLDKHCNDSGSTDLLCTPLVATLILSKWRSFPF